MNIPYTSIKENTWAPRSMMDAGWGNGYVHIPAGHPWYGKNYNDIEGVEINGGLTWSEKEGDMWVIGFDTAHSWDTLAAWPKEAVQAEADRLLAQVIEAYGDIRMLLTKTLASVAVNDDKDRIVFTLATGEEYIMYHSQDCCESVGVDDISGDMNDLIGSPILSASEDTNSDEGKKSEYDESFTWTFYNLSTVKGHVQIKWYGSSNGYYSESVYFQKA